MGLMEDLIYLISADVFTDKGLFDIWYEKVDQQRKNRIDKTRSGSDKRLLLGAGVLLDFVMQRCGIKDPEFEYRERNKPYLKGRDDFYFNISHSGNMVALAVSDKEVGLDIEKERSFNEALRKRVFGSEDRLLLNEIEKTIEDGNTDIACTCLWTVKESIMKYTGMGLLMDPSKIKLFYRDNAKKTLCAEHEEIDLNRLSFGLFNLPGYRMCVCSEKNASDFVVKNVLVDAKYIRFFE
ncbi:MAG: 4'-phosphopantetheinyl transferase superfamily protein [Butyrivibrio sp.]|nr:4'-phosphopantetheinyl transferase superfamily protein [Butyrivibrio sp.]